MLDLHWICFDPALIRWISIPTCCPYLFPIYLLFIPYILHSTTRVAPGELIRLLSIFFPLTDIKKRRTSSFLAVFM